MHRWPLILFVTILGDNMHKTRHHIHMKWWRLILRPLLLLQVQHNMALVEYYNKQCQDPDKLLKKLAALAPSASPNGTASDASTAAPAASSSDTAVSTSSACLLAQLNRAILLHNDGQHTQAAELLEPLYAQVCATQAATAGGVWPVGCHLLMKSRLLTLHCALVTT
jgi:hypothetical protein